MTRILYGVAGEGMGHAVRSRVVIEHLKKRHEVRIVAAGKAYPYLSTYFPVEEIDYFKIVYRDNRAANMLTVLDNTIRFPSILSKGWKVGRIIREFRPEVIITDFEPIVDYFGAWHGVPIISIDNQHIITDADHGDIARGFEVEEALTKAVIHSFIIKADKKFILSYFGVPSKKDSIVIPPLLREEILSCKPKDNGHILVYQTSTSNSRLISELKKIDRTFILYGFNEERRDGNVIFRKRNEKRFLADLGGCSGVITNGGFTLIGEALHLGKPILSIPVEKQFEQTQNALYLEKLGYGMYAKKTEAPLVGKFLECLPFFKKKLRGYKKQSNGKALRMIENTVRLLARRPGISHARSSRRRRDDRQR